MKIAIVGAGKLGIRITESLLEGDHSITIIDKNEELIQRINASLDVLTVAANGKEVATLKELDIDTYDFLIATTDRDEKNIVISAIAKKLGCSKVVARIRDPEHVNQLKFIKETMNIDHVTNPDLSIAYEINKYLVEKYTLNNGVFNTTDAAILEFRAYKMPGIANGTVKNAKDILGEINVIAISHKGKVRIPKDDLIIHEKDFVYIVGKCEHITELDKKVHEKGKYTDIQKVMIAGGGKTGYYLAKMLLDFGASVKIIEFDKKRCQYLSVHLKDALVLHGDATDIDLLENENYDEMDAFVTATGFDEENLLLALMAKQSNIEDVIAKISRESYSGLIENMGIDMALNPIDISASHVLRFIQDHRIISSQIIQGQAEMSEVVADEDMVLVDKPLKNLNLPKDVMIAAVLRGSELIIPDENTVIRNGDKIIIIGLLSEVGDLEKLIKSKKIGFFR